jgi:type IV pilus assembly protein PilZ
MSEIINPDPAPQTELLTLRLPDKDKLYMAYMSFPMCGGLFIPTEASFQLGDSVNIQLELLGQNFLLRGKVIWITPPLAQGGKLSGIGIQFMDEEGKNVQMIIEEELKDLDTHKHTDTM